MTPNIHIIANGGAKGMADPTAREEFVALCAQILPQALVEFVDDGKDVGRMVENAIKTGTKLIAAAGGDGTINAVASKLVGTDVVLGVVPMGTLNHFSRDAGVPQELEHALRTLQSGVAGTIDVGMVNDRIFLNNSGLGLYPDMVHHRVQRQKRGLSKWPAMLVESARALSRYRVLRLQVEIDGKALVRRTPAVFIGNNEYSLEGTLASKRETLVDGNLCLYIPHPETRLGLVWFSLRAFFGNPQADGVFDKFLTRQFSIQSHHKQLRVSLDGEVVSMQPPLEYSNKARALRVMLPASATA
ncbi:MAG: NAD(+)/NADH kinase [Phycisphaerae bacterium]|nr:NAD(+)/NADH kinase [Gemmatimonadaceae bacterium]